MTNTLIRMFHYIEQAQAAREALLAAGFGPDELRLDVAEDEAGPVEGNFVLDRKDTPEGAKKGYDAPQGEQDGSVNSQAMRRGTYLLTVDTGDGARHSEAADITARHGAIDLDARMPDRAAQSTEQPGR